MRDAGDVFEYASVPEVSRYVSWVPHRTLRIPNHFSKHVLYQYEKGIPTSWGIELKENGKLIGTGGYLWWALEHSKAELGYVISNQYWNRGYATETLRKILEFGFEAMSLERIEARCFVENIPSERVMQKCGMKLEGILRSSLYIKGHIRILSFFRYLRTNLNRAKLNALGDFKKLHMRKKIPSDINRLVSPDLSTVKVLELLCRKGGKYSGEGLNDNHQKFTGELSLTPVVNNYGINIAYTATAEDATIINEEHTLIALDSETSSPCGH